MTLSYSLSIANCSGLDLVRDDDRLAAPDSLSELGSSFDRV